MEHCVFSIRLVPNAAIAFLIALALAPMAFAQATGSIKGRVKDLKGDGIGGATVTARLNGKDLKSTTSSSKGDFLLGGLESGTYNIVFDKRGYSAGIKYSVEVTGGKTKDLGDRLILLVDRGTQVIVNGSVYYKDGTSLAGAKVVIERINADGSTRKMGTGSTSESGEFTFRQAEGKATFRITVSHKGVSASKDVEVETAAIYRLAISLDLERKKDD